uniref:U6 snRNA-associated Sm-like protein LSm3 n=1 Tax=Panagrolaimus sp. JU765 TaxID=591449 RepID=A0AC34Q642_9BILA
MSLDFNGELGDLPPSIEEPIDFIRFAINEQVLVKMRTERVLTGVLHSFDQHLNMILGDVIETINVTEIDTDSGEEINKSITREIPLIFVRGDSVVLVSTPTRTLQ